MEFSLRSLSTRGTAISVHSAVRLYASTSPNQDAIFEIYGDGHVHGFCRVSTRSAQ